MENLLELLENNFEKVEYGVYASWLNDDQKEFKDAYKMFLSMPWLDEKCYSLFSDNRVKLVVDDRALIVNVL